MTIKYGDYHDNFYEVEVEDEIVAILVNVITGDEVVNVITRGQDGLRWREYDNGERTCDFDDGSYLIDPQNKEEFERWQNRKSVYGFMYGDEYEDEECAE